MEVGRATLLHIHLHHFTPNGGVSGVAVLAESHISIHCWPEAGYAALDVFMCGDAEPRETVGVLEGGLQADQTRGREGAPARAPWTSGPGPSPRARRRRSGYARPRRNERLGAAAM